MTRTTIGLTLFGCLFAVAACADTSGPASTSAKTAPSTAAHTRYILASGDVLPEGCSDLGNGLWLCDDGGGIAAQSATEPAAADGTDDQNDDN